MYVNLERGELVELTDIVGVFEGHYSKVERRNTLVVVLRGRIELARRTMVCVFGRSMDGVLQSFYVTRARLKKLTT